MDIKTLKGIAVVAIENGEKIGTVADVLFDVNHRRIYAFAVGSGGLFSGTTQTVEMTNVQSIGTDAVMIQDRNVLRGDRNEDRYRAYPDLSGITSLRVVTDGGSYVGTVATVRVDEATGAMTDLEISRGGFTSAFKSNIAVPIDRVVSIGKDVAVIPDNYAETHDETGEVAGTEEPLDMTTEKADQSAKGSPMS